MYYYLDNLDMVDFWVSEIMTSKQFYDWLKHIIDLRYSTMLYGDEAVNLPEKAD